MTAAVATGSTGRPGQALAARFAAPLVGHYRDPAHQDL